MNRTVAELRQFFYRTRAAGETVNETDFELFRHGYGLGHIDGKAAAAKDVMQILADDALNGNDEYQGDPWGYYLVAFGIGAASAMVCLYWYLRAMGVM